MTDRRTVRAIVYAVIGLAVLTVGTLCYAAVTGVELSERAGDRVNTLAGIALGALITLLTSTRSTPPADSPDADPAPVPVVVAQPSAEPVEDELAVP